MNRIQPVGSAFTFIASDNRGNTVTSFSAGSGYMRTGATGGFLYVPQMSGAPSSTGATGYTGTVAMCFDTQNNIPWYLNIDSRVSATGATGALVWSSGNGMVLIGSRILSSSASSMSFTGIPQLFNNLIMTGLVRSDSATQNDNLIIQFNGDTTTTNYWYQRLSTVNTTTTSLASNTFPQIGQYPGALASANYIGNFNCTIPEYSNSTYNKSFTCVSGFASSLTNSAVETVAGQRTNTAPITSITLSFNSGSTIASGSQFQLYGIW